ncbi:MAG: 16S rRNA (uracil(1498)-N(3))-methyltransferase [Opitutales bacterium]|nr:16S rRNA (uracil(1498)-N(3))-methyltransferase [Opitutales bacterium]
MSGFRAYFENLKDFLGGDEIFLSADESRHLCGSLRARAGDGVEVFDLAGLVGECVVESASQKRAGLRLLRRRQSSRAGREIILAQALPKGKTFEEIISAAVQIGASKIVPIISGRTIVRLDAAEGARKAQKWRARVAESVKQSGNLADFEVCEPVLLADFLKSPGLFGGADAAKIVCSLEREKAVPILAALSESDRGGAVCVLIGPEGDFSADEYSASYAAGFRPASLGENVMKCEVAAAFALSAASAYAALNNGKI